MNSGLVLVPGMGLNFDERHVLQAHANGKRPREICDELHLTPPELSLIEQDIRFKLKAKTNPHMISRAFQLGLLRMMCLILCFSIVTDLGDNAVRVRVRTRTQQSRSVRSGRRDEGLC